MQETAVFTSIDGTKAMSGSIGTLFVMGKKIGKIVFKSFSKAVVTGVKESADLWTQKINGTLPDEDADDVAAANDGDNNDEEEGDSDDEVPINADESNTGREEGDMDLASNEAVGGRAGRAKVKRQKTYPSWKAPNCSDMTVGDMVGRRKKITKMDEIVLKFLAVPRTESTDAHDVQSSTTVMLLDSEAKNITREMLLVLIRYYYAVLRYLFLMDASFLPEFFDSSFFCKTTVSTHVEELRRKGLTKKEESLIFRIERIMSKKSIPNKNVIVNVFKDMRLMLTPQIDLIVTIMARTVLEEAEKCVNVGTVEECWTPWSQRIQRSSSYMKQMEKETCNVIDSVSINDSFEILCVRYDKYIESTRKKEQKTLRSTFHDEYLMKRVIDNI